MKRLVALAALVLLTMGAAGTAKAAALSCGTVITTSGVYALTADLNCSALPPLADAILVTNGADVTINLNGNSIIGPGTTTGSEGIRIETGTAQVTGGVIRGFGTGVSGVASSFLGDNIRLAKNGTGLRGDLAFQTVLHLSSINENTGDGISASVDSGITMSDSRIVGNGGNGITDHEAPMNLQRNVISRNGGYGIWEEEWGVYLQDNQVNNNGNDGIHLGMNDFPDPYSLFNNTAIGNAGPGIVFDPLFVGIVAHDVQTEGNVARDNALNPQCVNIFCRTH
jgi:Right handed beta helix region